MYERVWTRQHFKEEVIVRHSVFRVLSAVVVVVGVLLVGMLPSITVQAAPLPKLRVSDNGRFLVKADGSPFFYLADTAWELFHRLNRSEATQYLQNRTDRKYSVIQAVALAELDGLNTPNAQGDRPLLNNNPATPDTTAGSDPNNAAQYDYWDHVDFIVNEAEARGLYIALLPTWGSHVTSDYGNGVVNGVFNTSNAQAYGQFLGSRYANKPIIWVIGGDRTPSTDAARAVWRALAKGVAIGVAGSEDYSQVLMTFHPPGGATSATWFHNDAWLDFNMQQNGHCTNVDVWNRIGNDYNRTPTKPTMDGEPLYEDHPICFNAAANGYSNDYEVRKFAYWNVFAGAHGHTYGNHSVWQMHAPSRGGGINGPISYWYDAINQPGAAQMQHLRTLIEGRPFLLRVPDQSVLTADGGSGTNRVQATRGSDGSYFFVYSASGQSFSVNMNKISGSTTRAYWYNPRNGTASLIGSFPNTGTRQFTPPSSGSGNDWVLVVDDASRNFAVPGSGGMPVPSTPTPTPTTPAGGSFYRAIDLNGSATTIDGRSWEGSNAPNYSFVGTAFANQGLSLTPATDANRATMIRSSIWSASAAVTLSAVPSGSYTVYVYVWEDNSAETFSVALEGSVVQANYNSGAAGTWVKLGPWTTSISDGTINITTSGGAANLSGIEVWQNGSSGPTPTPLPATPTPTTAPGNGFVKGINFNGNAVTIEGNAWQSYSTALASGLSVNAPNLSTTALTPSPATNGDTSAMLNSAVWKNAADLNVVQTLPNGNYTVFIWVMENYQSSYRSFNLRLEGTQVASGIGTLNKDVWAKYGPYTVSVNDGSLNLDLVRISGDPHVMGLAIFQ